MSYNIQQKETYQARIEEMELQSVNNNNEMKCMTHDMKTVNTKTQAFITSVLCAISYNMQQKETYQARIEEMEIQSVNNNNEIKYVTHNMKMVNT